jgi:hypothetical protein
LITGNLLKNITINKGVQVFLSCYDETTWLISAKNLTLSQCAFLTGLLRENGLKILFRRITPAK